MKQYTIFHILLNYIYFTNHHHLQIGYNEKIIQLSTKIVTFQSRISQKSKGSNT